jgi:hypothetical protein
LGRPRFLSDEDLRRSIVHAVRRLEPSVSFSTVVDEGLSGTNDEGVLDFAQSGRWLVVSHDVNTMKAVAERRVAESLVQIWLESEFEEWKDKIVYLPV